MKTDTLYYEDPFLCTFTATVRTCEAVENGYAVTLDRTAFYPEGGGQPADHGTLGGIPVLDVQEQHDEIVHTLSQPLAVDQTVEGVVDWDRRFDHMQQHSGEHILSGILCDRYHCDNVGFHLGADTVTIDYNTDLTWEQVMAAEAAANAVIWADRPVEITYPDPDTLAHLAYRSKKELTGPVRIVTFPEADCCACCGTHVQRTGQVGQIKIIDHINYKSGTRLQVVCGTRALMRHRLVDGQCRRAGAALSAPVEGLADAVQRQKAELEAAKFRLTGLENQLFALWAAGETAENPLVSKPGLGPDGLRRLAAALSESRTGVCCAVSERADGGLNYAVACTRTGADLRPLCKEMNQTLDGRGGGKPGFVQGSLAADITALQAFWAAQHFTE